MTFNSDGLRETPGVQCDTESYHIYIFGGSTLWGEGAPDWGTIPAYLQNLFNERSDYAVCVHNMGQRAFHLTQEVVEFVNHLQQGFKPDMVIFYDGINEIGNTMENGKPWIPSQFSQSIELGKNPLNEIITNSNTFRLLRRLGLVKTTPLVRLENQEIEAVLNETIDVYLNNYEIVDALSDHFEFEYYFFWQPMIAADNKILSPEEEDIVEIDLRYGVGYFSDAIGAIRYVYDQIRKIEKDYDHLYYIGDVFNEVGQQIYIDIWHITPEGNELIADRIFDIVELD